MATAALPAPVPAAAGRAARPRHRVVPALIVGLVLAALCLPTLPRVAPTAPGWELAGGARSRSLLVSPAGRAMSVESAAQPLFTLVGDGSDAMRAALDGRNPQDPWRRSLRTWSDTTGAVHQVDTLQHGAAAGVETLAVVAPDATRRYLDPRLDIPAGLGGPHTWTSQGSVVVTDAAGATRTARYEMQGRAEPESGGCWRFSYDESTDGGSPARSVELRCPGTGLTELTIDALTWRAGGFAAADDPRRRLGLGPEPSPAPATWAYRELALVGDYRLDTVAAPQRDRDMIFLATGNGTLVASRIGPAGLTPVWWALTGAVTTFARVGDVLLLGSTDRELTAYSTSGRWLWTLPLADATTGRMVRVDEAVVFATLDGQVRRVDLRTGEEIWRVSAGGFVQLSPSVSDDAVVVATQDGRVSAFALDDGRTRWSRHLGKPAIAVAAGQGTVVTVNVETEVAAFSLADGEPTWDGNTGIADDALVVGPVVLFHQRNGIVAFDLATGAFRWGAGCGSPGLFPVVDRALALCGGRPVLIGPDGALGYGPSGDPALSVAADGGGIYATYAGRVRIWTAP